MSEQFTTAAGVVPAAPGVLVSIFVPDAHPLLQLKWTLDWSALTGAQRARMSLVGLASRGLLPCMCPYSGFQLSAPMSSRHASAREDLVRTFLDVGLPNGLALLMRGTFDGTII